MRDEIERLLRMTGAPPFSVARKLYANVRMQSASCSSAKQT